MFFDRKELAKILPTLRRSCPTARYALPVLANVRLSYVSGGFCEFVTTDLEVVTRARIEIDFESEERFESFAMPFKEFAAFVRSADGETVSVTLEVDKVCLCSGGVTLRLDLTIADEYPTLPLFEPETWNACSPEFNQAIETAAHAVSVDETRIQLNGFWIIPDDENLRIVATDGHRLARRLVSQFELSTLPAAGCIVPQAFETCCGPVLRKREIDGEIAFSGNRMGFKIPGIEWTFRLIEAEYPNWVQVLPNPPLEPVAFNRERFVKALIPFVKDVPKGNEVIVKLELLAADGVCVSSAERKVILNAGIKVSPVLVGSEIGFNARYLLEAAKVFTAETINLRFAILCAAGEPEKLNALSPITLDDGREIETLNVVMPMRIR